MKLNLKLVSLALLIFTTTSCKDDEALDNEVSTKIPESEMTSSNNLNLKAIFSENHKISASEAMEIALNAADDFSSESTRSGNPRTIENYAVYGSTKSGLRSKDTDSDSLIYVFNFADNQGFAIVSADDRIQSQVLAFVDEGSLEENIDDPGMSIFLENLESYAENSISDFEKCKDSLKNIAEANYVVLENVNPATRASYSTSVTITKVSEKTKDPLLAVTWGQGSPYNRFTPIEECGRTPTGCVATATAQIMSYWKFPKAIGSYTFEWDKMTESPEINENNQVNIAQLMFIAGLGSGVDYDCGGSSAKTENAYNWLETIGYKKGFSSEFYNGYVITALDMNCPLLANGKRNKTTVLGININYSGGHCWVIDGYKCIKNKIEYKTIDNATGAYVSAVSYSDTYFLHNNWGWEGYGNGYFLSGVFDVTSPYQLDNEAKAMSEEKNYKYKNNIYCVTKFK